MKVQFIKYERGQFGKSSNKISNKNSIRGKNNNRLRSCYKHSLTL